MADGWENCHRCSETMAYDMYMNEWYCPRCESKPSRLEKDVSQGGDE